VTLQDRSLRVEGTSRRFLLAEPDGPASAIVFSLHGTRGTARRQARLSRMEGLAADGAVVAFPEALRPIGSGFEWDHVGDAAFLETLASDLGNRHPHAGPDVCMTGMSGGARMSCHFAWTHAAQVRMVGAVAGLRALDGPPPSRPVPVLAFHGTADRINPYPGSGTARWGESVPDAARSWAVANGVQGPPSSRAVSTTLTRTDYGQEGSASHVRLWTFQGAGHTWPGAHLGLFLRLVLGRTSKEIDATQEIWNFAGAHGGGA
jgi:polyhydroxybutyrate depolymerase